MNYTSNNKRLAKNTLLLYFRTFFTLLIGLYTSRVVLNALGVEDFGIYNVVGGLVVMFSLLSGSLTSATQRFIAYEMGKSDGDPNHMFSASLTLHLGIAAVVIILGETIGLWFLNTQLVIAADRMVAANWVYQFSILTFAINIISIPYNGLIVAHERMDAFAVISILEAVLKLGAVLTLQFIFTDRLILYAFFLFVIALLTRLFYGIFCKRAFDDSKYRFFLRSGAYKRLLGFTGWNLVGSSSTILANQGISILINIFFGVVPNAARGIAAQVDNALNAFVNNFTMALNPQITKAYASGDSKYVMELVVTGGKLCFYLFLIGSTPIIFCAPEILKLWLKIVPDHAVSFVRLSLIYILIQTWSQTLYILMLSSGDIKKYQIIVGGTSLLSFPLTWIAYLMGASVDYCYYILMGVGILCLILRLYILSEKTGLVPLSYFTKTIIPSIITILLILAECYGLSLIGLHWIGLFFISFIFIILDIFIVGLNQTERKFALSYLSKFKTKFTRK